MMSTKVAGMATAIGSLPHRDPIAASEFVLDVMHDLPTIPSLPQRSPFESMLAQGAVGVRGINVNRFGEIDVRGERLSLDAPVVTDLDHDAFTAFRTFLDVAPVSLPAVKWQVTGPVTLGMALLHLGGPIDMVFDVVTTGRPLSLSFVKELHARMTPARFDALVAKLDAADGTTKEAA